MSGLQVDQWSTMWLLLAFAVAGVLLVVRWPKLGVLAWLLVIAYVPDWKGHEVAGYWPPAVMAAAYLVVLYVPTRRSRLSGADLVALAFFAACLAPLAVTTMRLTAIFAVVCVWLLPFLLGRLMPLRVDADWIYTAIAIVMTVVAVGAVLEFVFRYNPFVLMAESNPSYNTWAAIQMRGGMPRVEGAFGHSIALGATLAMAIPFVLASRLPTWARAASVAAMLGAIGLTFSRGSLAAGAAALLLSLLFLRGTLRLRARAMVLVTGLVCAIAAYPLLASVFSAAGDETARSGAYRFELATLLQAMKLVGGSDLAQITGSGRLVFGDFKSIDSALVLLGLSYGKLALLVAVLAYLGAVLAMLRGRGGPAMIAVVAQLPTILTVAQITQYASFFWFVAGIAVFAYANPAAGVVAGRGPERAAARSGAPQEYAAFAPAFAGKGSSNEGASL